jgi:long-chain acyl-CoA synthetase
MTAITTQGASIAWIALDAARRFGPRPALTSPHSDPVTYAELGTAVREIATGLVELGIEPGDHVAILASTRPEWTLADYGILAAGATVVPIYPTNSPEECGYVLRHSEAVAVVCEDAAQLAKVERVRDECPALATVVLIDGDATGAVPLAELRRMGAGRPDDLVERRLDGVEPSDVATIVYTSGTTGPPKGCVTTHGNLRTTAAMYERELELGDGLSMTPSALPAPRRRSSASETVPASSPSTSTTVASAGHSSRTRSTFASCSAFSQMTATASECRRT